MLSKAQFEKIVLSFEGVEKGTSYGHPAYVLAKKFFTRFRAEDNSAVLFVGSLDEREMLMEVEPEIFHVTSHYKDYPIVLARLDKLDAKTLRGLLQRHWTNNAPKKLLNGTAKPVKKFAAKKTIKKAR
jgi:Uncharacterized protein conserved in bacteria